MSNQFEIPEKGMSAAAVSKTLEDLKYKDINWPSGKFFGYVFYPGEDIYQVAKDAYTSYFATNGLNPSAFPSLRKMETDIVSMSANLLHGGDDVTGVMTSGGTESIMMAVLSAREWALRKGDIKGQPEVLAPASAHPAFPKACHFFGIKYVEAPLKDDFRVDVEAMKKLISPQTILLVASAPQFPQGVIDPISEVAALANHRGLLCHVDACVGGFLLPFLEMGGVSIPAFDFRVPGVTSISADLHKYGYTAKGASVILYRDKSLRRGQFYIKTDWTGGIYGSPSFAGTRPGGAIAAAWAVLNYVGKTRYTEMAMNAYQSAQKIKAGILAIPGLTVLSEPDATLLALSSDTLDVHVIADEMYQMGWYFNRQQFPDSLHIFVTDIHIGKEQMLLDDLKMAVKKAKAFNWENVKKSVQISAVKGLKKILPPTSFEKIADMAKGSGGSEGNRKAAMYGMMGAFKGTGKLNEMVLDFIDQLNSPEPKKVDK
jgi:sphinganine-1-phosphate aldolase